MRFTILIITLFTALTLTSQAIGRAHNSSKNARKITFNEINYNAPSSGYEISLEEINEIKCNRITNNRYYCKFSYFPYICSLKGNWKGVIHGFSYVTFRRYNPEINLHIKYPEC